MGPIGGCLGLLWRGMADVGQVLLPSRCAVCAKSIAGSQRPLCEDCRWHLEVLMAIPACRACAKPLAVVGSPCPFCSGRGMRPYRRIIRLGPFHDPLRKLIHQMKYHRQWTLAEDLARLLLRMPEVRELLGECDCVIPVPLHWSRQIRRGYNQADTIARPLARAAELAMAQPLRRARRTPTQTFLHSRAQRMRNLSNAFALRKGPLGARGIDAVRGRHVVVIDDVFTSGATLKAVAKALKLAAPASISAIVLAVADPRGVHTDEIGGEN